MKINLKFLKEVQKTPTIINDLNENDIAALIREANNYYYNKNKSVLSDEIYDFIVDHLKEINPENPVLKEVGAPVNKTLKKVKLPYWMGSQDKIKTDPKVLERWINKYPGNYVLSDKIDGISALLIVDEGNYSLYTRGDGKNGTDISHTVTHINNIPKNISIDLAVRGELVISKKNWQKIKHLGANPRNTVAGVFNSKNPNLEILKYVDFIAYELLNPLDNTPNEQYEFLRKNHFESSTIQLLDTINVEVLSKYFDGRRERAKYEIDGIVVTHNSIHNVTESGNPKYSFAFKNIMTHDSAEVTVLDVQWDISKDGYLVPIVIFPPTNIGGVQIQRATGFNAKFIKDNKIGPGSKIVIIRSGDVIPHIIDIKKHSDSGEPLLPNVEYTWTDTGVDIIINNKNSDELQKKLLINFFTKMKTKGLSTGIITKLYNHNFKTIHKILNITLEELKTIDGIHNKMATNLLTSIKAIDLDDCASIMVASNIFGRGFGERKIKLITDAFPDLLNNTPTVNQLKTLDGVNEITAVSFIEGVDNFKKFLRENELSCIIKKKSPKIKSNKNQNLQNINILFTGFRDSDMENDIISRGGIIKTVLNKNINILLVKDENTDNNKVTKANELNIRILTKEQFTKNYLS